MWNSPIQKLKSPSFLSKVKTNADYKPFIRRLLAAYKRYGYKQIHSLTYSMRMTHDRVGTREEFEVPYFERRYFLSATALLALLYPENGEYLFKVQDMLWAICDEWSWAGCSHTTAEKINAETFIDLFAAETGLMLTEICLLLGDKLDEMVVQRTHKEIRRRIINSYENRRFWWEWATNNWTMVCSGNVASTMLYLDEDAFARQKERLFFSINNFMEANPDDGTCLEGLDYWHYGFGNYVWFADLYLAYTGGKSDLFRSGKIERLAGYPCRNFLCGNAAVSIADSLYHGKADIGLLHFLMEKYPQNVTPLPKKVMTVRKGNVGWHELSRNLLYFNPTIPNAPLSKNDCLFAEAGQAIMHKKSYSLFVKAGHNEEPHNHNDVGSFILATKQGQILCDIGAGRYVDAYFQPATRYDFLCNSSRGHSVPIINGKYQQSGKNACGTLTQTRNTIQVDFSAAYGESGIETLVRTFSLQEAQVIIKDEFTPNYESFTERFVSFIHPTIEKDCVRLGNVRIYYDYSVATCHVSTENHVFHCGLAPHGQTPCPDMQSTPEQAPVYLIDFHIKQQLQNIAFTLSIED